MEKEKVKIVDISGKKSIDCPFCGFTLYFPPRTISMEKLEHMQDVNRSTEWRKKHISADIQGIANVRMLICTNCGKPIICKDEFSREYGS
jgi:predicted RNA-binding Zn-ribbon protein involved in translation (DUF1610 family)